MNRINKMHRVNKIHRRKKRRILFRRIRAGLVFLIFILVLNKFLGEVFISKLALTSNGEVSAVEEIDDRIKVVLDPGHGGYDTGAIYGDIYEKDIVLNVSNKVGEILEENNINVIYTRTEDTSLGDYEKEDLRSRVEISNEANADYFISFHINDYVSDSYYYEEVDGFEVWTDYTNENSVSLGTSIENKLYELNYTQNRPMGDGSESLHVIRENNATSVLIELGFMSDYEDRIYLSNEYNQELIAEAVANAIIENINNNSKEVISY